MNNVQNKYFQLIAQERQRQDEKWGADRDQHNFVWQTILTEEVGEAAECCLNENNVHLETELIQCAAVIIAWLENLNAKSELHGTQVVEHSVQRTPEQLDRLHENLDEIIEVGTGGE